MSEKADSVCEGGNVFSHTSKPSSVSPFSSAFVERTYELHDEMPEIGVIYHMDVRSARSAPAVNWHENVEILLVRSGEGRVLCNSEPLDAIAGDIFVFSCHYMHSIVSAVHITYDVLIVDKGLCRRAGIDTNALVFTPRIRGDNELTRLYRAAVARAVVSRSASPSASLCGKAAVHGAALSLMAYLCEQYARFSDAKESKLEHGVRRVIHYMQEHIAESMTVDGLAAVAGFSKYHFLREFKRYTSFTAVAYLNLIRIERAKQMLSCGASVSEAALSCGFGNFSYFSKVFRAHTGMSPMDFVKKENGG